MTPRVSLRAHLAFAADPKRGGGYGPAEACYVEPRSTLKARAAILIVVLAATCCDRSEPRRELNPVRTPARASAGHATPQPSAQARLRTAEEQRDFELLAQLSDAIEKRVAHVGYSGLSIEEKTVYVVSWLEAELNNGGFDQYFFNSAADNARDVPDALVRVGADQLAKLVTEVNALFPPPGPSPERATRQRQLDRLASRVELDDFDDRFYRNPENLEHLVAAFARAHVDRLPNPLER